MPQRKGFTLVELMIVVAIIGILAAIAIPNFVAMQYRSKRAELPPNVDGIKTAELAYDANFDTFLSAESWWPDASPGKQQREWTTGSTFDDLGWAPNGKVRGSYYVTTLSTTDFVVEAMCDVDGDGTRASYTATKSVNATFVSANNNIY